MVTVLSASSTGVADPQPIGGPIAGAPEEVSLNEGFYQLDWMAVFLLPIDGETPGDLTKNMAGQMRYPDPGQNQKPGVIGDEVQITSAGNIGPTEKVVTRRGPPRSRAKEHTGQVSI